MVGSSKKSVPEMAQIRLSSRGNGFFPTSLCGVLVFDSVSRLRLARLRPPFLSHTIFHTLLCHPPSFTHNFVTHHFVTHHLSHNFVTHHLSHTIFHRPLCHPPSFTHNFVTHHFVTHHLSHNFVTHHLSHTIFHRPLCHPPSFTHNFVTHHFVTHHLSHNFVTHHLSHTIFHTPLCHPPSFTQLCHTPSFTHNFVTHTIFHTPSLPPAIFHTPSFHTTLSPIIFHTQLCHTPSFTHHLAAPHCVALVALAALGWIWWHAWARLVAGDAAALCVAGVALGDIYLRFAWQARPFGPLGRAWAHLVAGDAAALCAAGYGTWRHPPLFPVAGVALGDIFLRFAWQAWHLRHCVGSGGALGRAWARLVAGALCEAGVALGDINLYPRLGLLDENQELELHFLTSF